MTPETNKEIQPAFDIRAFEPGVPLAVNPLELFCEGTCEVRILLQDAYKTVWAGVFDDFSAAQRAAMRWDGKGNVYFTVNPVKPELLAGRLGGELLRAGRGETAGDAAILSRRWFYVDFDPVRPSGISATEEEKAAALGTMRTAYHILQESGFAAPVICDSGNGYHLLYRIDLPNTPEATALIKGVLSGIDLMCSTGPVKVDVSVCNASRITKLYGTLAVKGKNVPSRPWRRSGVLRIPQQIDVTPEAVLRDFAAAYRPEPPKHGAGGYNGGAFDLDRWLDEHGVAVRERIETGDGVRYVLEEGCPFNPEHTGKDAVLFRRTSGAMGFKCFHNSCSDKSWKDFRLLYEPDAYRSRKKSAREDFAPVGASKESVALQVAQAAEAKTLDQLLPDDLLESLFEMEDEIGRQREIARLREVAKKHKFAREFDAVIRAKREQLAQHSAPQEAGQTRYITLRDTPLQGLRAPAGWVVDGRNGVWRFTELEKQVACSHPILITDRLQNVDTHVEKLNLAFYRDRHWTKVPAKRSTVASRTSIVALADTGIQVNSENAKYLIQYLHDLETENADTIPRSRSISRAGWVGETDFFPFSGDYTYDGEETFRDMYEALREAGDADVWLEFMRRARGENAVFRALLAASLSAPLLAVLGNLCYCAHVWGTSGTGKTVALYGAMSVWGDPVVLTKSFNATELGLEKCAAFCNSIPLGIDERETTGGDERFAPFERILYRLTEGRSRTKSDRSGNLRPSEQWRLSILTTGEAPLLADNAKEGAFNRAIELCADGPLLENAPEAAELVKANYGHAGKRWVKKLIEEKKRDGGAAIRESYQSFLTILRQNGEYNDKPLASVAAMMAADFYSSLWLFDMDCFEAMQEANQLGEAITGNLSTKQEMDGGERSWEYIQGWVASNKTHFQSFGDPQYGFIEDGNVFIVRDYFNMAMREGHYDAQAMVKEWDKCGWIARPGLNGNGKKRFQTQRRMNGIRVCGYLLKMDTEAAAVYTQA